MDLSPKTSNAKFNISLNDGHHACSYSAIDARVRWHSSCKEHADDCVAIEGKTKQVFVSVLAQVFAIVMVFAGMYYMPGLKR